MVKINTYKIGLGLLLAVAVTNPLTNQWLINAVISTTEYTVWITLLAGAYFAGLMAWGLWTSREKTNIPKKSARTQKAGKFLI